MEKVFKNHRRVLENFATIRYYSEKLNARRWSRSFMRRDDGIGKGAVIRRFIRHWMTFVQLIFLGMMTTRLLLRGCRIGGSLIFIFIDRFSRQNIKCYTFLGFKIYLGNSTVLLESVFGHRSKISGNHV